MDDPAQYTAEYDAYSSLLKTKSTTVPIELFMKIVMTNLPTWCG
jgi:hypothetical protein